MLSPLQKIRHQQLELRRISWKNSIKNCVIVTLTLLLVFSHVFVPTIQFWSAKEEIRHNESVSEIVPYGWTDSLSENSQRHFDKIEEIGKSSMIGSWLVYCRANNSFLSFCLQGALIVLFIVTMIFIILTIYVTWNYIKYYMIQHRM